MAALAVPMGIGRFAFTPLFPMMQADAGLSLAEGGWLASANYAGTLLGALAAMRARVPAPAAIRGGLVTIALATLAMGVERRFAGWLVLRALAGAAMVWVIVFASAWALERLAPLRRPWVNSAVFAGYGVGIAVAGLVCLGSMAAHVTSARVWTVLGALAMVVAIATWPVFGAAGAGGHAAREPAPRWDADAIRIVLCYGAFGFGYIVSATFLPVMARQAVADPSVFGWAWPLFGVAAAAASVAAGALPRSLANRRLWLMSHVVMAVGVVLPVLVPGIVAIMLSALLVGATFTVTTMAGFQEARMVQPDRARRLIGALASAFSLGQIVALAGVSALAGGEFTAALVVACAVLLVSAWALRGG
jgi:predicted MFS family arabinose efflux permease